jgi:hypothetical protein
MRPTHFSVCRAEFIHGDGTRVKRPKAGPRCERDPSPKRGSCSSAKRASFAPLFGGNFFVAPGCYAHRAAGLAERMRRVGRRAHFLERRGKLRLSRDRSFHLVSGWSARSFRREFPSLRPLRRKAWREIARFFTRVQKRGLPVEFARGIPGRSVDAQNEGAADFFERHNRSAGRLPRRAATSRAAEDAGRCAG